MSKFSDSDRRDLERNPNVLKVSQKNVQFTVKFKLHAVKEYSEGILSAGQIFTMAGINLSLFYYEYASDTIIRWKEIYEKNGKAGLDGHLIRKRKKSPGRPKKNFNTLEEELESLRMEVYVLKKLKALAESKKKKGSR